MPGQGQTLTSAQGVCWVVCKVRYAADDASVFVVELLEQSRFHAGAMHFSFVLDSDEFFDFCMQEGISALLVR